MSDGILSSKKLDISQVYKHMEQWYGKALDYASLARLHVADRLAAEARTAHEPRAEAVAWCDPADIAEKSVSFCGVSSRHWESNLRYTMPLYSAQPPGALHQVAAIAGDTSYAAEDRIEKIQSLLSGVNPSPSPDARVVNGCRLGDQGDAVRGAEHDRSFASGRADNRTRPEPAAGRDRAAGHDVPAMDEECVVRGLHEGIDRSSSQIQPPGDAQGVDCKYCDDTGRDKLLKIGGKEPGFCRICERRPPLTKGDSRG